MAANEELGDDQESYEVVELESEDGEVDDFVVVDRLDVSGVEYVILALLEDVESMEDMTDEELRIFHSSQSILFVMRVEGEDYVELEEEEYQSIEGLLKQKLEAGAD